MPNSIKKHTLLVVLLLLLSSLGYAQKETVKILKDSYKKGFVRKTNDSLYYQKMFFTEFPSNFKSFKELYGYNDLTGKNAPLSDVALDHINHLFRLKSIDRNLVIKKVVSIAINASYQVDGINYFNSNFISLVSTQTKPFIEILDTHNNIEITSVWAFYFDYENSFDRKKSYDELMKLVAPFDPNMISLIKKGYQRSTRKWKKDN